MSSLSETEFERHLQPVVSPSLEAAGFAYGGELTYHRAISHEGTMSTQLVGFQLGDKGLRGRFSANLGVFNLESFPSSHTRPDLQPLCEHCMSDLTERIGFLRPVRRGLMDRFLRRDPVATDHWWKQSADPRMMQRELSEVTELLNSVGMLWLESRTSMAAFQWAHRRLEARKKWKESFVWKETMTFPHDCDTLRQEPFPEEISNLFW